VRQITAGPAHLPIVLTREEVAYLPMELHGFAKLMCALMYGAGLRVLECVMIAAGDDTLRLLPRNSLEFPRAALYHGCNEGRRRLR
jgi:hypothetical protein